MTLIATTEGTTVTCTREESRVMGISDSVPARLGISYVAHIVFLHSGTGGTGRDTSPRPVSRIKV